MNRYTDKLKDISKKFDSIVSGIAFEGKAGSETNLLWELIDHYSKVVDLEKVTRQQLKIHKTTLVFIFFYACLGIDLTQDIFDAYWKRINIQDPLDRLEYLLKTYSQILFAGPFIEYAVMALTQIQLSSKTGRGLFHDCLHCSYLPFTQLLFTSDKHFTALKHLIVFPYHERIINIPNDVSISRKAMRVKIPWA